MKLHLGCGQRYFLGYINVDYPPNKDNVVKPRADLYSDVTKLSYARESIMEIRSHHLFEHFDRPTALAQLCRWRDWLKRTGLLRIETPDLIANSRRLVSPFVSKSSRDQLVRHLYGSHEADWAVHRDGWYKEKFRFVLSALGFEDLSFQYNHWGTLYNIEVFASRSNDDFTFKRYLTAVRKILVASTVRVDTRNPELPEGSELKLLNLWLSMFKESYQRN